MKTITFALFIGLSATINAQKTDPKLKGIEKELNQVLKDQGCAGFSVAVVKGNEIVYLQGFGYRDVDKKLPVTANTLFAIGSSSKAFTAGLIGILQEQGSLKLDDKTIKYLPNLKIDHPNRASEITIRDMMCHRTGLPRYDYAWYLFNDKSKDTLLSRLAYMKPNAELRAEWQYNNFMFLAQGLIAERITGKSWEENIAQNYFTPLEMRNSNTSIALLKTATDGSFGYTNNAKGDLIKMDYFDIMGMGPAGSINSSAQEMTAWLKVWINGGKYNGKQILPPNYVEEAMSSQMVVNAGIPTQYEDVSFTNYGLGWMMRSYRGHYQVQHGGNIDGFSANVSFFPTDSIGIVVLSNQEASPVPNIVRNLIADRMLGLEKRDWNGDIKKEIDKAREQANLVKTEEDKNQVKGTTPSHKLSDYEGDYYHPGYGTITISAMNDSLKVNIGKHTSTMIHYHYDYFKFGKGNTLDNQLGGLMFSFNTGVNGKIASLSTQFDQTGEVKFERKEKTVQLTDNELNKYVGEYDLSGTTVTVSVKNNTLYVFVPGQTDYEMVSVGNNTFNLVIAKGYSVVFEVKDNNVLAMSFVQPNGTFTAKRK